MPEKTKPMDKYHRRTEGAPPEMGEDPILLRFGANVRRLRDAAGLTQGELAERCEKQQTWISYVERGTRDAGLTALPILAKALRVSMSTLLGLPS